MLDNLEKPDMPLSIHFSKDNKTLTLRVTFYVNDVRNEPGLCRFLALKTAKAISKEFGMEILMVSEETVNTLDYTLSLIYLMKKEDNPATIVQPPPIPNEYPAIADLVLKDINDRVKIGLEHYKVKLQPFNGRSAKRDAYQELIDLLFYLRQDIYEEENPQKE